MTIAFAMDDPSEAVRVDLDADGVDDVQSLADVYALDVPALGRDVTLGTYQPSGVPGTPPVRGEPFPSQLVGLSRKGIYGLAGSQGNPICMQRMAWSSRCGPTTSATTISTPGTSRFLCWMAGRFRMGV